MGGGGRSEWWRQRRRRPKRGRSLSLFLAISTFCDGLLTELDPPLLLSWGHVLVHELIALSGRYPHVSGFYRLIRVVTTVADSAGYFERLVSSKEMAWSSPTPGYVASPRGAASAEATILTDCGDASIALGSVGSAQSQNERSRCYAMLSSFLLALLQRSRRFQDELLASALELLLAAPLRFMRGKLVQMTGVIHLALSMGHAYQPLVSAALGALERLNLDSSTRRRLQPHLPTLLPCLHSYLNVTSEGHTAHAGRLRNERDARRNLSASSRNAVLSSARTRLKRSLEDQLQQRVVAFLGSVGGDALALVHGSRLAPPAEGRWEIAPRVKMNLPSADISERDLELHLDAILPRVVEVTRRARARARPLSHQPPSAPAPLSFSSHRRDPSPLHLCTRLTHPSPLPHLSPPPPFQCASPLGAASHHLDGLPREGRCLRAARGVHQAHHR